MVSKKIPNPVAMLSVTQWVTIAIVWPAKSTLGYSFKDLQFKNGKVKIFILSKF